MSIDSEKCHDLEKFGIKVAKKKLKINLNTNYLIELLQNENSYKTIVLRQRSHVSIIFRDENKRNDEIIII